MADRYGTNSRSSSLESEEDMSSLLRNLLHNSFTSIPSSSSTSFHGQHKQSFSSPPPTLPPLAIFSQSGFRFREGTFNSGSSVMVQSSTDFNFSDLEESTRNTSDDFDFDCKTDKASMLDEAIEYLKQLQLQVQMLSMRNGFSLNDLLLLGSLHPTQTELLNTKGGEDTFSGNQEIWMRASFDLPNQCTPSNQQNLTSPAKSIPSLETSFGLEPSIQNYY